MRLFPFLLVCLSVATASAQQVIYVDHSSTNSTQNGNAWATAYHELRDAMVDARVSAGTASSPVEVWVAGGTYKPTTGADRTASFVLKSHLRLRGGFNGTEQVAAQRGQYGNIMATMTVLSGDIGLAQTNGVTASTSLASLPTVTFDPADPGFLDNSENVLLGQGITDVVLDGLIVTGGHAADTNDVTMFDINGMTQPSPSSNSGDTIVPFDHRIAGGGLAFLNAPGWYQNNFPDFNTFNLTVQNCIFIDNDAQGFGGAMAVREALVGLHNSEFLRNSCDYEGGAFWGQNQLDDVEYCYFNGNFALRSGGAVHLESIPSLRSLNPTISDSDFLEFYGASKSDVLKSEHSFQGTVDLTVDSTLGGLQSSPGLIPPQALDGPNKKRLVSDSISLGVTVATLVVKYKTPLGPAIQDFAESMLGKAALKKLTIYNGVGTLVTAVDFSFELAGLLGEENNPTFQQAYADWNVFYTYFNYATPVGFMELWLQLFNEASQPTYEEAAFNLRAEDDGYYNSMPNSLFVFCQFETNQTAGYAGALLDVYDNVQIEDSRFDGNTAVGEAGAAAFLCYTAPVLISDAFLGNHSALGNSAIVNAYRVQPRILNCTIMNNGSGVNSGCALDNEIGADTLVGNSILWGNTNTSTANLSGGADIFTSTRGFLQSSDTNGLNLYNQAGNSHWAWVGMCDVHYSCVQSLHSTALGSGDIYIPNLGTVDSIIQYHDAERLDDQLGTRNEIGFFNVGEGTRETLVNSQYGNNSLNPSISSDGVSPSPGSPMIGAGYTQLVRSYGTNTYLVFNNFDWSRTDADLYGQPRYYNGQIDIGAVQNFGGHPIPFPGNPFDGVTGSPVVTYTGNGSGAGNGSGSGYVPPVQPDPPPNALVNLYVNLNVSGGTGDGSSWANAKRQIPSPLTQSLAANGVLWIAGGSYSLSTPIVVADQISVYGGFLGNETSVTQSDPAHHPTILTGSANNQQLLVVETPGSNNIIQGLVFSGVRNSATEPAAVYDIAPSVVQNCVFSNITGVAAYAAGSPVFKNCVFVSNTGAPALNLLEATAQNCVFSNNLGIAVANTDGTVSNCQFIANTGSGASSPVVMNLGGTVKNSLLSQNTGLAASGSTGSLFDTCQFVGNSTNAVSAYSALQLNDGTIANCTFTTNIGTAVLATGPTGGGVNISGSLFNGNLNGPALSSTAPYLNVSNCRFIGNRAVTNAGAVLLQGGTDSVANLYGSEFYGNVGGANAGAIYAHIDQLSVYNCTIYSNALNSASAPGGAGIRFDSTDLGEVFNTILASNVVVGSTGLSLENQQYLAGTFSGSQLNPLGYFRLESCIVQGLTYLGQPYSAAGSFDADPRFVDAAHDNLQLHYDSFAIDAGATDNLPGFILTPTDLAGNPRVAGKALDIGAYEAQGFTSTFFTVPVTLTETCDGSPSFTIQANVPTNAVGTPFVWQVNRLDGQGFVTVNNDSVHSGVTTTNLQVTHPPSSMSGAMYRIMTGPLTGNQYLSSSVTLPNLNSIIYVNQNVSGGAGDGSSWANAMSDLQAAMNTAGFCSQIWVAQGTYNPGTRLGFAPGSQVEVYGGFVGTETALSQRDWQAHPVMLQAGSTPALEISSASIVDGFYIHCGYGVAASLYGDGGTLRNCVFTNCAGIGIWISHTGSFTLSNCQFYNCADSALYNDFGQCTLQHCLFSGNQSQALAGAIENARGGLMAVSDCRFLTNSGPNGGAINNEPYCGMTILRCSFLGNHSQENGGAITAQANSSTVIGSSLLAGNTAFENGGAVAYYGTNFNLAFSTLADNSAGYSGGGIYVQNRGWSVESSIFWGNTGGTNVESAQIYDASTQPIHNSVFNTSVQGSYGDTNFVPMLPSYPLFVDEAHGDYHLTANSPLLNMGTYTINFYAADSLDLDGNVRPYPGRYQDAGCYQFQGPASATTISVISLPASITTCPFYPASFSIVWMPFTPLTSQWQEFNGTSFTNVASSAGQLIVVNQNTNTIHFPTPGDYNGGLFRMVFNSGAYTTPTFTLTAPPPAVLYVNASAAPGGDGTSWATAFQTLTAALATVQSCSEIWVAAGDYPANLLPNNHQPTLQTGIKIYGGFVGTETDRNQRDYVHNVTRLVPGNAPNILLVGYGYPADSSAVLDGFHLAGQAGTAMTINGANPTIRNCTFENNGTGLDISQAGNMVLDNCQFQFNTSMAVSLFYVTNFQLINCEVISNTTSAGSAAIFGRGLGNFISSNCVFQANTGPAMLVDLSTNAQMVNCQFLANTGSPNQAGVLEISSAQAGVTNCVFAGNQGATPLWNNGYNLVIERCSFTNNSAPGGSGLTGANGSLLLKDSLVANNQNTTVGGTIEFSACNAALLNDTIADNSGTYSGVGLGANNGSFTMRNCIVWNNTDSYPAFSPEDNQVTFSGVNPSISYSIIQGLNRWQNPAHNNLPYAPFFADEAAANYQLLPISPAIGSGSTLDITFNDIDLLGNPRERGNGVDRGVYSFTNVPTFAAELTWDLAPQSVCADGALSFSVQNGNSNSFTYVTWLVNTGSGFVPISNVLYYSVQTTTYSNTINSGSTLSISSVDTNLSGALFEFVISGDVNFTSPPAMLTVLPRSVLYVDASASGTGNGSSWANAFTNLAPALAQGGTCTSIAMAGGVYPQTQTLTIPPGVEIDGGYASGGGSTNRDPIAHATIIQPAAAASVAGLMEQDTAELPGEHTILDGLNFRGGAHAYTTFGGFPIFRNCLFQNATNGAFECTAAGPYFTNCVFGGNAQAILAGSASVMQLSHCLFTNNTSGAVLSEISQLTVSDCTFRGNTNSNNDGGAINVFESGATVTRCVLTGNSAGAGGGIAVDASSALLLTDSLLNQNTAVQGGALEDSGSLTVNNCTIADNTANEGGALAQFAASGHVGATALNNCIVWNNAGGAAQGLSPEQAEIYIVGGTVNATNSIFQYNNSLPGRDSFKADPLFANSAAGDYTLTSRSPAVDAGDNEFVQSGDSDLAGHGRIAHGTADVGAYESGFAPNPVYLLTQPQSINSCLTETATFQVTGGPPGDYQWQYNLGGGWVNISDFGSIAGLPVSVSASNSFFLTESTLTIPGVTSNLNGMLIQALLVGQSYTTAVATLTVPTPGAIYVDASAAPGGNGTSWATAVRSLLDAISMSSPCQPTILVAQGTYTPTGALNSLYSGYGSFVLPGWVKLYGGFPTGGGDLTTRDWHAHPAILTTAGSGSQAVAFFDGGIGGPFTTNTILDGFVIDGGTAAEGLDVFDCNPTLRNLTVRNVLGSGFNTTSATLLVSNCDFINNHTSGEGGGAALYSSQVTFLNCAFQGNSAAGWGGGIYSQEGSVQLLDVLVTGNRASMGGGLFTFGAATMVNGTVADNYASSQGGGVMDMGATMGLYNSIIWGNRCDLTNNGSAYYLPLTEEQQQLGAAGSGSAFVLNNDTIQGLQSYGGGALVKNDPVFMAPIDAATVPSTNGNFHLAGCSPLFGAGNINYNGSILLDLDGQLRVTGGHVDLGPYQNGSGSATPLVITAQPQDLTFGASSTNNTFSVTATGDLLSYQWQMALPGGAFAALPDGAAYSGVNAATMTVNQAGLNASGTLFRCVLTSSEGCIAVSDEARLTVLPNRYYVNATRADDTGDGTSWATAFKTLARVTSAPCDPSGTEIWCAAGTYSGANATVRTGDLLYGGFAGTETDLNQRNWQSNLTVLTAGQSNFAVFSAALQIWDYPTHLGFADSVEAGVVLARVDGFQVNGANTGIYQFQDARNVTIANCTFTNCQLGIWNGGAYPVAVSNCLFLNAGVLVGTNGATVINSTFAGSGLANQGGNVTVIGSHFAGGAGIVCYDFARRDQFGNPSLGILYANLSLLDSDISGAALALNFDSDGQLLVQRCSFRGNGSVTPSSFLTGCVALGGREIFNSSSYSFPNAAFEDCLFSGNVSLAGGGAVLNVSANSATFRNCTFAGNRARAIYSVPNLGNAVTLLNCIAWGNATPDFDAPSWWNTAYYGHYSNSPNAQIESPGVFSNNIVQNLNPAYFPKTFSGFVSIDPGFVSPIDPNSAPTTNGDFHLTACSSVLGLGDPAQTGASAIDLDGQMRLYAGTVAPGAYQAQTAPLIFLTQPANFVGILNQTVTFTATAATTNGATYQWQVSTGGGAFADLSNAAPYSGVTTASLDFAGGPSQNGNAYRLRAQYPSGCSVASLPATYSYYMPAVSLSGVSANGVLGVSATNFSISMPNGLNNATLNDQTLSVYGMESGRLSFGDGSLHFDGSNLSATRPLHPGEQVFVTVNSSLQSSGGIAATPATMEFFNSVTSWDGFFTNAQPVAAASGLTANLVQSGDLNGDGLIDLFVSTSTGCRVFTNSGTGTFAELHQTVGFSQADKIILGNVRGHGLLDAVLLHQGSVVIATNNDSGLFGLASSFSSGPVTDVALGDLNNDGLMDLFVLTTNNVQVWWNAGGGNFVDSGIRLSATNSVSVALGDFNGDGNLDAYVVHSDAAAGQLWLNNGNGTFADGSAAGPPGVSGGYQRVVAANVRKSGHLDLVCVANDFTQVWQGNGDGSFSLYYQFNQQGSTNGNALAVGDLNGDGKSDLILPAAGGVLTPEVSIPFAAGTLQPLGHQEAMDSALATALADLNGDGALDLALISSSGQLETAFYQPANLYAQETTNGFGSSSAPFFFDSFLNPFGLYYGSGPSTVVFDTVPAHGDLRVGPFIISPGNQVNFNQYFSQGSVPTFAYVPDPNFSGVDSFTWRAILSDSPLAPADPHEMKFRIFVAPIISVTANPDYASVNQSGMITVLTNGVTSVLANDADTSGNGLIAQLISSPSHGTVQLNSDGTFSYRHDGSETHADSFSYRAVDQTAGKSSAATVFITINNVNEIPSAITVASNSFYEGQAGGTVAGVFSAQDPDPAVTGFTFSLVSGAGATDNGLFTIANNVLLTTTPLSYADGSTRSIRVQASSLPNAYNPTGSSTQAVLTINVLPLPGGLPQSLQTPENGGGLSLTLTGTGVQPLQYTVVSDPTNGTLKGSSPNFLYQPNANFFGSDSVAFVVSDGVMTSAVATVSITVNFVDQPPVASGLTITTTENVSTNFVLPATPFLASEALSFELNTNYLYGTLTGSPTNLTYTPPHDFHGNTYFSYTASENGLTSQVAYVSIGVSHVNQPPIAATNSFTVQENSSTSVFIYGSDPDFDSLTYRIVTPPQNGTLSPITNTTPSLVSVVLTYKPAKNFNGTDTFTYVANDGQYDSDPAPVTITVTPQPVPVALDQTVTLIQTQSVNIVLTSSNLTTGLGNLPASYRLITFPQHGSLLSDTFGSPNLTYTPSTLFYGTDSFTFIAYIGGFESSTGTVQVVVLPQSPSAASFSITNTAPGVFSSMPPLQGHDFNNLPLTYHILTQPTNGVLVTNNLPYYNYLPNDQTAYAPDRFTYQVDNGYFTSQVATVTVFGLELEHGVNISVFGTNSFVGIPVMIPLSAVAEDPFGDPLTFLGLGNVTRGTVTYSNNVFTYTPTESGNLPGGSGFVAGGFTFLISNRFETATGTVYCANYNRHLIVGPSGYLNGESVVAENTLADAVAYANSFGPDLQWLISVAISPGRNQVLLTNALAANPNGDLSAIDITGNICIAPASYGTSLPPTWPTNLLFSPAGSLPMRLFQVEPGATLCLSNCYVSGGSAALGGAIYNQGATILQNSGLTNNTAKNFGGAIYNLNGSVALTNSSLAANTAQDGGGLYQIGDGAGASLTASNSVLNGNTALNDLVSTNANGGTSAITSALLTVGNQTAPSFSALATSYLVAQNPVATFPVNYDPAQFQFTVTPPAPWNDGSVVRVTGAGSQRSLVILPPESTSVPAQTITVTLGNSNLTYSEVFSLAADPNAQLAPVAHPDYAMAIPYRQVSIPVLANDVNPNGTPSQLTLVSVSTPGAGTATIDGTNIDYTDNNNSAFFDTFTYVVSNGSLTSTGTVHMTFPTYPNYQSYISSGSDGGLGTLRSQIEYVGRNYFQGGSQIILAAPVIDLTSSDNSIDGPSALVIANDTIINGNGATIQVDANAAPMRLFHVLPGASLTLMNVTLIGGTAVPSNFGAGDGGAIYNEGRLDLENVTIVNCQAQGNTNSPGLGGALFNVGSVVLNNVALNNNTASSGGGIYQWADGTSASVIMTNTSISNPKSRYDVDATATNGGNTTVFVIHSIIQNPAVPWVGQMGDVAVSGTRQVSIYVGQGTNHVTLAARSDNENVVPTANLSVSGSSSLRQLQVNPVNNGVANILLEAASGSNSFTRQIALSVFGTNTLNPVAPDYTAAVYSGQTALLNVLANDHDLGNTPLQLISVSGAQAGTLLITNSQILYQNAGGAATNDFFTYVVTNTFGGATVGNVYLTINPTILNLTAASQSGPGGLNDVFSTIAAIPGVPWTIHVNPSLAGQRATLYFFQNGQYQDYTAYVITDNVTIDGSDAPGFTIEANNNPYAGEEMRHFRVEPGATLTLKNLNLSQGLSAWFPLGNNSIGLGGSILNEGTLNVTNVHFVNNSAQAYGPVGAAGGAIANKGGVATIVGSSFQNNYASGNPNGSTLSPQLTGSQAGAIFNYNGTLMLISNTFSGNSAHLGQSLFNAGDGANASLYLQGNAMDNNPSALDLRAAAINGGTSTIVSFQTNLMSAGSPSIGPIADQVVANAAHVVIALNASPSAVLTASSTDTNVIPNGNLVVLGAGDLLIVPGTASGNATVALTLTDGGSSYSQIFQVTASALPTPFLDYAASPQSGPAPLTVHFQTPGLDSSNHTVVQWFWNFGDGGTSTNQNPVHTFVTGGQYAPSLSVTNDIGGAVLGVGPGINVAAAVLPYAVHPPGGVAPASMQFVSPGADSGGATIVAWNWSLGDGTYSSEQNPAHTFSNAGSFAISLTATNSNGVTILGVGLTNINIGAPLTVLNYYRLGEEDPGATAGSVSVIAHDSVGSNDLVVVGSPVYSTNVAPSAALAGSRLSLDLSSGAAYATNSGVAPLDDDFCLEAWVYLTNADNGPIVAYYGDPSSSGWGIGVVNGVYQALMGGVVFFGSGAVTLNQWTHLALVSDSGVITLYVNGRNAGTDDEDSPNPPSGSFAIGTNPTNPGDNTLFGLMDEVRLSTFTGGQFTTDDLLLHSHSAPSIVSTTTVVGTTNAALTATIAPNGMNAQAWITFGQTTNYSLQTPEVPVYVDSASPITNFFTGLQPGTLYHYQLFASNSLGAVTSGDATFVTVDIPRALTNVTWTASGQLSLSFAGAPDVTYTLLQSTNVALPLTNWTVLGHPVLTNGLYYFTDPSATNPASYYELQSH